MTDYRLDTIARLLGPLATTGEHGRVTFAAYRLACGADPNSVRKELAKELKPLGLEVERYWPQEVDTNAG